MAYFLEDISVFDSFYLAVIFMTIIGYGDFSFSTTPPTPAPSPPRRHQSVQHPHHPHRLRRPQSILTSSISDTANPSTLAPLVARSRSFPVVSDTANRSTLATLVATSPLVATSQSLPAGSDTANPNILSTLVATSQFSTLTPLVGRSRSLPVVSDTATPAPSPARRPQSILTSGIRHRQPQHHHPSSPPVPLSPPVSPYQRDPTSPIPAPSSPPVIPAPSPPSSPAVDPYQCDPTPPTPAPSPSSRRPQLVLTSGIRHRQPQHPQPPHHHRSFLNS
ncbi:lysine-rich arabinogalactan protein 19-like [Arachis ipaensis]|uniref:lysine-rich arabinogalactan protein 19-like n=1 Tax=Arachis ipaensis TaxID=130454 RepID=UPI0007AEFFE6|nr:lysine-rich arabinogalactan protein 19-like [Arachis ipaensis]